MVNDDLSNDSDHTDTSLHGHIMDTTESAVCIGSRLLLVSLRHGLDKKQWISIDIKTRSSATAETAYIAQCGCRSPQPKSII